MSTTISLCNLLPEIVGVTTTVTPSLASGDWSILTDAALPRAVPTPILTFNRDDGITDHDTWTFSTALTLDGVDVRLEERVTGTALGSTMSQSMSAGAITTGFVDTNDARAITFTGESGAIYGLSWALSGVGFASIAYTLWIEQPAYRRVPAVMQQVETIVVLMLENRSLDNVLGWLHQGGAPSVVFPAGSSPSFDGIPAGASNAYHDRTFAPSVGTEACTTPCRVPAYDPNEGMPHVEKQLYADARGELPDGDPWAATPPMSGFVWDFDAIGIASIGEVMGAYSARELPVLYGLASSFAVSDAWFASVPTQTFPNRAFSICGTSRGAEVNGDITDTTFANATTIFNVVGDAGKSWGVYWQMDDPLGTGEPVTSWAPFTPYYFPMLQKAPNGTIASYRTFLADAARGALPSFCYLEPFWGGGAGVPGDDTAWVGVQGNDYHPPAWIGPAEVDLNMLYEALKSSPQWSKMLFVLLFDEHGGTWDHVPPGAAPPPDASVGPSGFRFDRYGVRVPAILISPFVQAGTVFRAASGAYDHTSLLATLCKWVGVDPASANLGARTAVAPTFEDVLGEEARTDTPAFVVPVGYASQGGGTGGFLGLAPPERGTTLDVTAFRALIASAGSPETLAQELRRLFVPRSR